MRTLISRCLDVLVRRRRDERLSEEIQTHLDLLTDEHIARGLSPAAARLAARKSFGGVDQIKERYRDQRSLPFLDMLAQDVRFALRLMRKNLSFNVTAGGSLALSIGALTLAFSLVNAFVFKPLPIDDPDSVYSMQNGTISWSYPDYRDLRERLDVDALAGYRISMMNVGLDPEPEILWGYLATGNYFEALGIEPAAGRFFRPDEDARPGAAPLAVIAYDTWQARFGGRSSIVGSTIAINGLPFTVLGVAPKGFHGTEVFYRPEIWVPMSMQAQIELGSSWLERRETQNVWVIARLKAGVSVEQGKATIGAAVAQLSKEHPRNGPLGLRLTRPGLLGDTLGAPARAFAWGLFGLGALLMLAGCSNLAGLLLARGNDRSREIAMRSALGAGKARIARQLLTESIILSSCGGLGGAALAWVGTRAVTTWRLPTELPVQFDLVADTAMVVFAAVAAVIVGVIVGVAPARFATGLDLAQTLKSTPGVMVGGRRWQGREILVAIQVALCVVLLHASFLAVRGLQRATTASIGWNPEGIVTAATEIGLARYNREQAEAYWRRAVDAAKALPGVTSAAIGNSMPLHIDQSGTAVFTYPATEPETGAGASVYQVGPGYFNTLQIPMRDGRDFTEFDTAKAPAVAVINRALAERLFGAANPLGRQLREGRNGPPTQVIGVVEDGKYTTLGEARRPAIFRPLPQRYSTSAMLIVRSAQPGSIRPDDVRRVIQTIDPRLPLRSSGTGEQITALPMLPYRAAVAALGLLGVIGSGLLLSGLHAMLAYAVVKRRREIGIRVALGADRGFVVRAILTRVSVIVAIGTGVGALFASGTGPLVSSLVLGVSPKEPVLVIAIVALLAVIALVSCVGPVRRSLSIDPLTALREE